MNPTPVVSIENQDTESQVRALGRAIGQGMHFMGKREADADHRESYLNDVGNAREVARSDPFGVNAVRTRRDSIVGASLRLQLAPDYESLGVSADEAAEWVRTYHREFQTWAQSFHFECDAQRKQTFNGLMGTMHDSLYVSGEAVAVMKFKPSFGFYETCVHIVEPERISTPTSLASQRMIREGIEFDADMAPVAYYFRERQRFLADTFGVDAFSWTRVPRYNEWGRPQVIHSFNHLRPDMTRGISTFASVIRQMRMLSNYSNTELETAITQAAYAATIKTDLPYDQAMAIIGKMDARELAKWGGNPLTAMMMGYMQQIAPYYQEAGIRYNGAKVPHLTPNESLEVVKSTHPSSGFSDFEGAMLRQLAAGLGIDYPALSKNYADVSYSGARAALADVWRSFMCARVHMSDTIGMPIVSCHMEEAILRGRVPMLGKLDWLQARHFLVRGMFVGWGKPLIDSEKERKAQALALKMGVTTRQRITAEEGDDFDETALARASEEKRLLDLDLPPEVLDPELAFAKQGSDANGGSQPTDEPAPSGSKRKKK